MTDVKGYALSLLYDKAREYLETYGWIQGQAFKGHSACLVGSCMKIAFAVTDAEDEDDEQYTAVMEAMLEPLEAMVRKSTGLSEIAYWNDEVYRSKEDVLLLLKQASENARDIQ